MGEVGPVAPAVSRGPLDWIPADAPAPVATARGLYRLRHWPAVVATLEGQSALPGAATILALARARLGETQAALDAFADAVAAEPDEPHARCAYAACLLRAGRAEEAVAQLDAVSPPPRLLPVTLSLRGAAHWQEGQGALARAADREAAAQFERSARAFVAAAERAATSRQPLPERLAAAYVGQAVAMVAAEQFGAVPPLFARRRAQGMAVTPALTRFARELYELCDLAARLEPSERQTAGAALRPVITRAVLSVNLWDGSQPVILAWHGLVDK
jgi:tetratricopeptide (TPR) repeat protein